MTNNVDHVSGIAVLIEKSTVNLKFFVISKMMTAKQEGNVISEEINSTFLVNTEQLP